MGLVSEPVEWRSTPSPEYIQTLRNIGASERTIELAQGIKRPPWWRRLRRSRDV